MQSFVCIAFVVVQADALKVKRASRQLTASDISGEVELETSSVATRLASASQLLLEVASPNASGVKSNVSEHQVRLQKEQDALQHLFAHLKASIAGINKDE